MAGDTDDKKLKKLQLAVKYYYLPVRDALADSGDYMTVSDVADNVIAKFRFENSSHFEVHRAFVVQALRDFYAAGLCELVTDSFADQFVRANNKTTELSKFDPEFRNIEERYQSLGASAETWLHSALVKIAGQFTMTDLLALREGKRKSGKPSSDAPTPEDVPAPSPESPAADVWEPLKIDRADPRYTEAVSASEAALREIESSNGYATSDPEERDGIVKTAKGALEAMKTGSPSKQAIIQGLLKPFEYIAKKFADSTMGEIAKVAVTKLLAWLFT